jgi:hypothetical protein
MLLKNKNRKKIKRSQGNWNTLTKRMAYLSIKKNSQKKGKHQDAFNLDESLVITSVGQHEIIK